LDERHKILQDEENAVVEALKNFGYEEDPDFDPKPKRIFMNKKRAWLKSEEACKDKSESKKSKSKGRKKAGNAKRLGKVKSKGKIKVE
jgi:hypothetical protein